jgi:REP element-mobilizing transposase RayT
MPRTRRAAPGGFVYHVLNRAVARLPLFHKDGDYQAFERVLAEALREQPTRLLGYCVMPNHWHLVVWPQREGRADCFCPLAHAHAYDALAHALPYRRNGPPLPGTVQEFSGGGG